MEQSRRVRKKDITHRAIMHSAKQLFERHGLGNVTIDQITDGADVSRSTFFSHFSSLDDLLNQIAQEEINDIFSAAGANGKPDVSSIFTQLAKDTYPYPYLVTELFLRSILSPGNCPVAKVDELIRSEIESGGYEKILSRFSAKDVSSFIIGAYFGLIFKKFINNEPFEDPAETNNTIHSFINYLKNQEAEKNE